MPQYANSRAIGYTAWSNPNWSGFMNSYAATPLNTGAQSGMKGITFFGSWSISAPWSGTYTMRAAADDFGSCNMGGNTFSPSGFSSGGNTTSKFFSKGQTITMQWSIGNSTTSEVFSENPCAIAWTLDGPSSPPAPSVSISVSPNPIIQGQCSTLSWSVSGSYLYSASISNIGGVGFSGSTTVCPSDDITYCITGTGEGGSSSACVGLVVYIPPVLTITSNRLQLAAGECATLSWSTTGDASSITWLSGNINNFNLTSSQTVCPSDTTTYSARVSGLGGEDTDSLTIVVHQNPTVSIDVPTTLLYGQQGFIEYTSQYANTGINLKVYFRNNFGTVLGYEYNLPVASSTQLSAPDSETIRSGSLNTDIVYDDFGPRFVDYVLTVSGSGGSETVTRTTTIIIDETPDNLVVEETDDTIKDQEPVYTPETEILSEKMLVDGIDIPVEIKANYPIQVDINGQNDWKNLRQI